MYKKGEEFLCGRLWEDGRLSKDYRDWVVVHHPPKTEPGKNIYPLKWASVFHVAEGNQEIRAYNNGEHLGLQIDLGVGDCVNPPIKGTIIWDSWLGTPEPQRHSSYTFIKVNPYTNRVGDDGLLFFAEKEGGVPPYKFGDYVTLVFKDKGDADVVYSTLSLFKE